MSELLTAPKERGQEMSVTVDCNCTNFEPCTQCAGNGSCFTGEHHLGCVACDTSGCANWIPACNGDDFDEEITKIMESE